MMQNWKLLDPANYWGKWLRKEVKQMADVPSWNMKKTEVSLNEKTCLKTKDTEIQPKEAPVHSSDLYLSFLVSFRSRRIYPKKRNRAGQEERKEIECTAEGVITNCKRRACLKLIRKA